MTIQKITLQNLKKVEDFTAEFEGGVYLITGENEVGKSTLLDTIGMLLTGERSNNLLTKGKEKGFAEIIIGDGDNQYQVTLKFSDKNPRGTLSIGKVGSSMKSDKLSALQDIFQYQDFDANEFVKWSESAEGRRKQVAIVKSLLPVDVQKQIADIDAGVELLKEERKTINANVKTFTELVAKPGVTPAEIKKFAKKNDAQELIDKKLKASETNNNRIGVEARQEARLRMLKTWDFDTDLITKANQERINNIKLQLAKAEEDMETDISERSNQLNEKLKAKADAEQWLAENPAQDLDVIQNEINTILTHNEKHAKVKALEENSKKLLAWEKKQDKQQQAIDKQLSDRKTIVKNSTIPIPGLDFDEDGITLNGIPFRPGEVSTSQEMEVAAKLIIAKNPTVKVFRIAQGESLGKNRLQAIVDFAAKEGYQGFIEEVHRGQDELKIYQYTEKQ